MAHIPVTDVLYTGYDFTVTENLVGRKPGKAGR